MVLGFALGPVQGRWSGQCGNLAPKHTYAGSGASKTVGWDPWVSSRSKQKCLGSEIHRESLAMGGASWLTVNAGELGVEVRFKAPFAQNLHLSFEACTSL